MLRHHWYVSQSVLSRTGPLIRCSAIFLPGDIKVLEHCPNIMEFSGIETGITGEFPGSFFRRPVLSQIVPRKIIGDIVVLQHCPNIKEFRGERTGITGTFPGSFFRRPVRSQIVSRKNPGDIVVLQHRPNIEKFKAAGTGITGTFPGSFFREKPSALPGSFFRGQSTHTSFRENSSGDIAVLANCKSLSVFVTEKCSGITGTFPGSFSPLTNLSAKNPT